VINDRAKSVKVWIYGWYVHVIWAWVVGLSSSTI
jgi:hypothetical protein